MKGRPVSTERGIQRAVLQYLNLALPLGSIVIHVANQDATGSITYGMAKIKDGMVPGTPDLLILVPDGAGRPSFVGWIEMKAPGGRLSPAQQELHPRLRAAGTPVEVCYSVDDVVDTIRKWGLKK